MSDQKITPCLWFDSNAEEAINFYVSVFKNSRVLDFTYSGEGPERKVLTGSFQLEGQKFMALNGGPHFKFTEAVSLVVSCDTQEEVDELWDKLSADKDKGECGWLKDKFGLSWQIVPAVLMSLLQSSDPAKSKKVMDTLMTMKKPDMAQLQAAYDSVE
eukprot:jgi/Chrzof1/57/Cz01g02020.t1